MDPNLFAIDGERLFEVLVAIAILSLLVERALALVFESRWFVTHFAGKGIKEPISFIVAASVCHFWDFDALSILFVKEHTQTWGHVLMGAVVAGGSKASIKLFHDVFKMMSTAEQERRQLTNPPAAATPAQPVATGGAPAGS